MTSMTRLNSVTFTYSILKIIYAMYYIRIGFLYCRHWWRSKLSQTLRAIFNAECLDFILIFFGNSCLRIAVLCLYKLLPYPSWYNLQNFYHWWRCGTWNFHRSIVTRIIQSCCHKYLSNTVGGTSVVNQIWFSSYGKCCSSIIIFQNISSFNRIKIYVLITSIWLRWEDKPFLTRLILL